MYSMNDFDFLAELGTGSFGETFKVKERSSGKFFALKTIPAKRSTDPKGQDREATLAFSEALRLASLQHPNLVMIHGAFIDRVTIGTVMQREVPRVSIVMDYCDGGDLRKYYREQPDPLDEARVLQLLQPMLSGLAYIHSKRVVHRDIKSENVLLSSGDVVKIADFGLAKKEDSLSKTQRAGTPLYMSPEANAGHAHAPADIFALAIIAIELATKAWPSNILSTDAQVSPSRALLR
jgi:serine/threonine protein kinase